MELSEKYLYHAGKGVKKMYANYNPNPKAARVGDCVIRAVSKVLNQEWERTYIMLAIYGFMLADLPSANHVWGRYLKDNGFRRSLIPDKCPACYTVKDFCEEHQKGVYLLALNGHVVAVVDGCYFDSWDSGDEVPVYFWEKEKGES